MIRRPPRSTPLYSSAASDVYKRQAVAARTCVHAALFGPAGPRLASALADAGLTSVALHETLAEAAADARAHAAPGRTIMFAPWFPTTPAERAAVPGLLSLIHISEPTRQAEISYAVFCL